jgi:hypothetical protein
MLKQMKHCAKAFEDEANLEPNPFIKDAFRQIAFKIRDIHFGLGRVKNMPELQDECYHGDMPRHEPDPRWRRFWSDKKERG